MNVLFSHVKRFKSFFGTSRPEVPPRSIVDRLTKTLIK